MAKFEKRLKARKLRRKGKSINVIARHLGVSKGTVSLWCRDLELTKKQKDTLRENAIRAGHKGRMMGAAMNRKKKIDRINFYKKSGKKEVGKLSKRDFLMAGLGLYWGEGTKKSNIALVNSDPRLILFMYYWFKDVMGVKNEEFRPQIFINDIHRPRARKLLTFWMNLLRLPKNQFRNIVFLKRNNKKVYENYDSYYGILALNIRRGTELKYRVLGLIEAMSNLR